MPAPDPFAIEYGYDYPDRVSLLVYQAIFGDGNKRNRIKRARRILRNLSHRGWPCYWCGRAIPLFRRADARFCGEGCRKRSAKSRRTIRLIDNELVRAYQLDHMLQGDGTAVKLKDGRAP